MAAYAAIKYGQNIYGNVITAPAYKLYIDWDNDGDFDDSYEEIFFLEVSFERGRDSELGSAKAGILEMLVNNSEGRYTPTNTGSPLSGDLLPGRAVKLTADCYGEIEIFNGFLQRITPHPELEEQTCSFYCVDGMDKLARSPTKTLLLEDYNSGEVVDAILDGANWPAAKREIQVGDLLIDYAGYFKNIALEKIQELELAERGFFYIDHRGYAKFESRYHRWTVSSRISKRTFNDIKVLNYEFGADNIINHAEIGFSPKSQAASGVIWTLNEVVEIGPGETETVYAQFNSLVATVAVPVPTTDFLANSESGGTGDDLTGDITVAMTAYGRGAVLEITNDNENTAFITFLQIRGIAIDSDYSAVKIEEDQTSIDDYDFRGHSASSEHYTGSDALNTAEFIVEKEKLPRAFNITISLENKNLGQWRQLLQRKISDCITLVDALTGINGDFYINSMRHIISEGGLVHETVYAVESADYIDAWTLGYSELGTETILG